MDWRDQGILISTRRHGESSAIVEIFTAGHGRHVGVVRGGAGRRMAPILQPGAEVAVEWSARLEEHIGAFRIDPIRAHGVGLMEDRAALGALGAVTALIAISLPEREPHPQLFARTRDLVAALGRLGDWPARYALWELALLAELGFGLDLARCAATGTTRDLAYVSPKSGAAVSRAGGAAWVDRLLPLPGFLLDAASAHPSIETSVRAAPAEVAAALRLTGFFLEARLAPTLPRHALPASRARAVEAILRAME